MARQMRTPEARAVLGLVGEWGPDDVKRNYRRLVSVAHPDVGGDAESFRRVQAAYELLEGTSARDVGGADNGFAWSAAGGLSDFRVASGAMTYLAVEPDLLDHLAEVCSAWEGRVAQVRKAAVRQLGWLVIGVVPFGAVISTAKAQTYRSTGRQFLAALAALRSPVTMESASGWNDLGRAYVAMLPLLDLDAAAASVDLADYSSFLHRLEEAVRTSDESGIARLMHDAYLAGRRHDLRNHTASPKPSGSPSTATPTQRFARSLGRKVGSKLR